MRIYGTEARCNMMDSDRNGNPEPGRYFVALITDENHGNVEHFALDRTPFRTNRSGEVKLQGWCGTTNNRCLDARGAVEVYRDKAGRTRCRRCDAQALLDERSPDSEI